MKLVIVNTVTSHQTLEHWVPVADGDQALTILVPVTWTCPKTILKDWLTSLSSTEVIRSSIEFSAASSITSSSSSGGGEKVLWH